MKGKKTGFNPKGRNGAPSGQTEEAHFLQETNIKNQEYGEFKTIW